MERSQKRPAKGAGKTRGKRSEMRGKPAPRAAGGESPQAILMNRKNLMWLGIAIGVIILGFISLALGSTTLAPILLAGGYLVLVPYAIMTSGRQREDARN
jgi:hypothetical protein